MITLYRPNGSVLSNVEALADSRFDSAIMQADKITLRLERAEYLDIPLLSYIMHDNRRFTLYYPAEVTKISAFNFAYTLVLYDEVESFRAIKFKYLTTAVPKLKFPITLTARGFAELIVRNLNDRAIGGNPSTSNEPFSIGTCIEGASKTLAFNHEDCLSVLNRIVQEFNTEWEFEGRVLHIRKLAYKKDEPLNLAYGKDRGVKSGLKRMQEADKLPVKRLYVIGGERNINPKQLVNGAEYGSDTLLLPKAITYTFEGQAYRTDEGGKFVEPVEAERLHGREDSFDGTEIYPKRVGTISRVERISKQDKEGQTYYDWDIFDADNTINYSRERIGGEKAFVTFQTGLLQGHSFDIATKGEDYFGYIHSEKRFQLVSNKDNGITLPNDTLCPKVGDTYAVFGVKLPSEYIQDDSRQTGASWELLREAVKYLHEHRQEGLIYQGELDSIYAKKHWNEIGAYIRLGAYIMFEDEDIGTSQSIRIVGFSYDLNNHYRPKLTLSNNLNATSVSVSLAKVEAEEVIREKEVKTLQEYGNRNYQQALETIGAITEALKEDFSEDISPISVRTMQLLAGDPLLQFVFAEHKEDERAYSPAFNFSEVRQTLNAPTLYLRHLTYGLNEIRTSHPKEELFTWQMKGKDLAVKQEQKTLYLYAKVSKQTAERGAFKHLGQGEWLLSESPQKHTDSHLFLLVGILSSANPQRLFTPCYGFTEVLPGRVTTDKIVSADGRTYFDLINNIISGRISFIDGAGNTKELSQAFAEIEANDYLRQHLKGTTNIAGGLVLASLMGVKGSDELVKAYINGMQDNRPAFAAGVENFGEPNESRNVEIWQDGNARFGMLSIDNRTGESIASFKKGEETLLRLGGGQSDLAQLSTASHYEDSIRLGKDTFSLRLITEQKGASKTLRLGSIVARQAGYHRVTIPAITYHLGSSVDSRRPTLSASATFSLKSSTGRVSRFDRGDYSFSYEGLPASRYRHSKTLYTERLLDGIYLSQGERLYVEVEVFGVCVNGTGNISFEVVSESPIAVSYNNTGIKEVVLSDKGLSIFYDFQRLFYLQKEGYPFLTIKGTTNMGGILASGYVNTRHTSGASKNYHASNGDVYPTYPISRTFGYYAKNPQKPDEDNIICHSFGGTWCYRMIFKTPLPTTSYIVQITPVMQADTTSEFAPTFGIMNDTAQGFQVNCGAWVGKCDFMFTIIGNNY